MLHKYTIVLHQHIVCQKQEIEEKNWTGKQLQPCLMTICQLLLGKGFDKGSVTMEDCCKEDLFPIHLDGIVFSDQSHTRAVPVGGTGQNGSMLHHQYCIAVNAETGALDNNGVPRRRRAQIKPKYDSYAQGYCSVAMPTVERMAKPTEMFNYTNKKLVSVRNGIREMNKERQRVKDTVGGRWARYNGPNPYF